MAYLPKTGNTGTISLGTTGLAFGFTKIGEWQATRGGRSGRVAWQFFTDLAAREGVRIG